MLVIPDGYAQITHHFTGLNVPNGAAVVYGVANGPDADANTVAEDLQDLWLDHVNARMTSDVSLQSTTTKLGPNDVGPIGFFNDGPHPGAQSATSNPPNVSYLVAKRTALGGRRNAGRIFIPGTDADVIDDAGQLGSVFFDAFQDDLNDWLTALDTATYTMVLFHGPKTEWQLIGGQPRRVAIAGAIPAPTVVSVLELGDTVSTQRRRLR